ncbi:MAG TPA: hypothetical protein VE978_03705 [Chitinophagales bacterium]|nr:hypothetical protein [Chitinophagales bacterium]
MKRRNILTLVFISIPLVVFFLIGLFVYLIDEEDCNEDPCEIASYSLEGKLDSAYNIFNLWSHPKNYCCECTNYDPTLVKCNIIYFHIGLSESELDISQDSIAIEFARIFWNDSLNSNVDSLYLELQNNRCTINYGISKNDLDKKYQNHKLEDFTDVPSYKVFYENFGKPHYGYYEATIFHVMVRVNYDYKNVDSLFLIIKNTYDSMLKEKKIDELEIDIEIDEPYCKLCLNQKYKYWCELTRNRIDASKKRDSLLRQ